MGRSERQKRGVARLRTYQLLATEEHEDTPIQWV
jgi:hypothetical protein